MTWLTLVYRYSAMVKLTNTAYLTYLWGWIRNSSSISIWRHSSIMSCVTLWDWKNTIQTSIADYCIIKDNPFSLKGEGFSFCSESMICCRHKRFQNIFSAHVRGSICFQKQPLVPPFKLNGCSLIIIVRVGNDMRITFLAA